jgi:hypothetical protein
MIDADRNHPDFNLLPDEKEKVRTGKELTTENYIE